MPEVRVDATSPGVLDLYSRGDAGPDNIDDYVGRWHDAYKDRLDYPPLYEYLGLIREEYEDWLYDPFSLPYILRSKQPGGKLVGIMAERDRLLSAANRREDGTIIFSLGNWLKARSRH